MALPQGFDFRASEAYRSGEDADPNEFIGSSSTYDYGFVTARGLTCGWTATTSYSTDRSLTVDYRLAGGAYRYNSTIVRVFRVLLPATGGHTVRLAAGDAYYSAHTAYNRLLDTTTLLGVLADGVTSAANSFFDATGVERTGAAWPTDNASADFTFTTTQLNLEVGKSTVTTNTFLSHFYIEESAGGAIVDLTAASLGFTAQAFQIATKAPLTSASLGFTAQTPQIATGAPLTLASASFAAQPITLVEGAAPTTITLTTPVLSYTANPVQNATVLTTTTAALSYTANALTVVAAQVVTLTAASLNYTANAIQNSTVLALASAAVSWTANTIQLATEAVLSAASLNWSAKDISTPVSQTLDLTAATLSFTAQQVQLATALTLSTASLNFTSKRLTVAIGGVVLAAGLLTLALLGVGQ